MNLTIGVLPDNDCVQVIDSDASAIVQIYTPIDGNNIVAIAIPGPPGPAGGSIAASRTISIDTNLTSSDYMVRCNTSTGIIVNLPLSTTVIGKFFIIKSINTGTVSVIGAGSDLIDGSSAITLTHQYESILLCAYSGGYDIC